MNLDDAIRLLQAEPERAARELQSEEFLSQLLMKRDDAIGLLRAGEQGIHEWNRRRSKLEIIEAAFQGENSRHGVTFSVPRMKSVDLRGVDLPEINLSDADLDGVTFDGANLRDANFSYISLRDAAFRNADLRRVRFFRSDLSRARLTEADLCGAHFSGTKLFGTDFWRARCWDTVFANVDLREVTRGHVEGPMNLRGVQHLGPSEISLTTIARSQGKIPPEFLRGCGVTPSALAALQAIATLGAADFSSCFISYSHDDEDFAQCLYRRLRDAGVRVWFAPEDIKGGQKLHEQICSAIDSHERLLVIISESSIRSEWVGTELRRARRVERRTRRRTLFPISVAAFEALQNWECFDADSGKDLAVELREYFIPDFSGWRDAKQFDQAVERLLRDLRENEAR
jgi:uncharacterized protein YjbI with pentapeptide repeats